MTTKRVSDNQWHALNDKVLAEGYVFRGNVMLPSDADDGSCDCPMCGRTGYWCVWYELPDDPTKEAWTHLCYDCGHMWLEYYDRNEDQS